MNPSEEKKNFADEELAENTTDFEKNLKNIPNFEESDTSNSDETEASESEISLEEELKQKLKDSEDRYLRALAEHENFKKRMRQDTENRVKFASMSLGEGFISGLDDLERALSHIKETSSEERSEPFDEFIKGIEMIYRQFLKNLEDNHYVKIEAKGEKFDPKKHEAIGMTETDEVEEGHVANVFKVGYSLHDRIIHPAMVQVAKPVASKE